MNERLEEIKDEWSEIKGYEGFYEISNSGKIKSYKRNKEGRMMNPATVSSGYRQISLSRNGEIENRYIHRLVAESFIPNPKNKPQVNHIDGDKENNFVGNLEWATNGENGLHAYENGLKVSLKGESHGRSKLTKHEALAIYFLANTGTFELKEIAKLFNIHFGTVSDIKLGRKWSHATNIVQQADRVPMLETSIKRLRNRVEELEEQLKFKNEITRDYKYLNQCYKNWLEDIRDITTGSAHEFAIKALAGEPNET